MKKLTLEHLCCYLPHELKVFNTYTDRVEGLYGLSEELAHVGIRPSLTSEYSFIHIKPILLPLSELMKEFRNEQPVRRDEPSI